MPWAVAAAGVSAAGSIGGGLLQSSNASKAGAQAQRNLELILPQMQANYVQGQNQLAPYIAAGTEATGATSDLLGLNGPDAAKAAMNRFQTSPGYNFQMEQGLRGIDAGAASQSILRSGATIKAEEKFGQNLANLDFGNYYNRLAALSGTGDTAIGQSINAGSNLISQEEGNAQSQNAAAIGGANAQNSIIGNTASGLGSTVNNLFSDKNFQNWAGGLFAPAAAPNYMAGTTNMPGTSPGYGTQTFNPGGIF